MSKIADEIMMNKVNVDIADDRKEACKSFSQSMLDDISGGRGGSFIKFFYRIDF